MPTGDPRPDGPWDALIVTSAHAEEALRAVADKALPVFAVGERTARAVRQTGFSAVAVAEGDAVSLSGLIRRSLPPDRVLLHVTARHHKEEPALSLQAAGFRVLHWEAYEAAAAECLPEAAAEDLRAGRMGAVLHYSRRGAELFLRLAKDAKIHVAVPVVFVNEEASPGLKKGGVLNVVRHELELVCESDKIPDEIQLDVTGLDVGDSIHISHVALPQGSASAITDRDFTIATVVAPSAMKQTEGEGEAVATGGAPAEAGEEAEEGGEEAAEA